MRSVKIRIKKIPAKLEKPKYELKGGFLKMQNANLFATLSTNTNMFTGHIGEDGTIYKYDTASQSYVSIGVDKTTWNNMVEEKDKYYKLGVEKGYIKTAEQIEEEEKAEREKKEKEEQEFKQTMLNTIKSLQEEVKNLKGGTANGHQTNAGTTGQLLS